MPDVVVYFLRCVVGACVCVCFVFSMMGGRLGNKEPLQVERVEPGDVVWLLSVTKKTDTISELVVCMYCPMICQLSALLVPFFGLCYLIAYVIVVVVGVVVMLWCIVLAPFTC